MKQPAIHQPPAAQRSQPPFAGHHRLNADLESLEFLRGLFARYPDIASVGSDDQGGLDYVINDPAMIRRVLVTNHRNYAKGRGFERVRMLLGNGIIVSDGAVWRRRRTMIQPGFSRSAINRLGDGIRELTIGLRDDWASWPQGREFDLTTATSHYALDSILKATFGDGLSDINAGSDRFGFLAEQHQRDLQLAAQFRRLRPLILDHVTRRRADAERGPDFLSSLLDARDKRDGEGFTDPELLDELATLIIAGHETTAGTLNWAWWLLAQHSQVEKRMLEEMAGLPDDENLSVSDVAGLEYCQQILLETLRLYPPVWLFSRRALESDQLGEFAIPAGAQIFICPYFLHRREDYWPDPERFDPDRFASTSGDADPSAAFVPFSAGPRRCIGEFFSLIEMRMHLAILARRFRLEVVPGQPADIEPAVNLRSKQSLRMRLYSRD